MYQCCFLSCEKCPIVKSDVNSRRNWVRARCSIFTTFCKSKTIQKHFFFLSGSHVQVLGNPKTQFSLVPSFLPPDFGGIQTPSPQPHFHGNYHHFQAQGKLPFSRHWAWHRTWRIVDAKSIPVKRMKLEEDLSNEGIQAESQALSFPGQEVSTC